MDDDFTLLGPTEKFAADQLKKAVKDCRKSLDELAEYLDEIDSDGIDALLQDNKMKESIIKVIPAMQGLADNLSRATMIPLILSTIINRKEHVPDAEA